MRQKIVVRYSEAFKMQVVNDLESGRFDCVNHATLHYDIKGTGTIKRWLKKYGRNHLYPKVMRVEKLNEKDKIRALKEEIKELKMALGVTQTKNVLGESFLKLACDELGMDVESFKKKVDLEQFITQKDIRKKR